MRLKYIIQATLLVILQLGICTVASAHPHNWIELNTRFVLDDQSRLIKVKQSWEFDMYYSMMTHADLMNEFDDEERGFKETARRMINSLKNYDYFSTLSIDGAKVSLGVPKEYRLYKKRKLAQNVLVLETTFFIEQPFEVENKALAWKVFDPTYYIAMNHSSENNIEVIGGNATECMARLDVPEPSDELIEYAQSLDKTQKDTEGLGASFAETVFLTCI